MCVIVQEMIGAGIDVNAKNTWVCVRVFVCVFLCSVFFVAVARNVCVIVKELIGTIKSLFFFMCKLSNC